MHEAVDEINAQAVELEEAMMQEAPGSFSGSFQPSRVFCTGICIHLPSLQHARVGIDK